MLVPVIDALHRRLVFERRVRVLAAHLAARLPASASVLDLGCGDGAIAAAIMTRRPDVTIRGMDVLVRATTQIPVEPFDGLNIPLADRAVEIVQCVDVLHHAARPLALLQEAVRVARRGLLIKDHYRNGLFAGLTLRTMDWVGNARHAVALPYRYWTRDEWRQAFAVLGLVPVDEGDRLGLYPFPLSLLVERGLHFVARLEPA